MQCSHKLLFHKYFTDLQAFEFCQYITSIRIPATVQRIGHNAFYGTALDVVTIEDRSSLTSIGNSVSDF